MAAKVLALFGILAALLLVGMAMVGEAPRFAKGVQMLAQEADRAVPSNQPLQQPTAFPPIPIPQIQEHMIENAVVTVDMSWELVELTSQTTPGDVIQFSEQTQTQLEEDVASKLEDPSTNDSCKQVEEVFGEKCRWEVTSEGGNTIVIMLKAGEHVLSTARAQIIRLTEFPEFNPVVSKGFHFAWSAHVMVAEGLRSMGIGKFVLSNTDRAIYHFANTRGLTLTRLFVDISKVKWGAKLMEGIASIWDDAINGFWVYIIKPPQ